MFKLNFRKSFFRKEEKLTRNNLKLQKLVDKTIDKLEKNPKNKTLKSHKVIRKNGEKAFSSVVNDDIRIIWDYHEKKTRILDIIDIGGHSGKDKVYI